MSATEPLAHGPLHAPLRSEGAFARHAAGSAHGEGPLAVAPFPLDVREVAREIAGAEVIAPGDPGVRITGVHHDSRRVLPGDLFVARAGARVEGASFVRDAIARGAVCVIVEKGSTVDTGRAARIEVPDEPAALAQASAAIYGHQSFALEVVGITGTNGKTTTAHLVRAVIDAAGGRAGIVGTLGYAFDDLARPSPHTSPEADELARIAAAMRARGASHLVMEASSIGIAAKRVEAVRFRVAAFTNLTQDHLDYHGTMEAYAAAKARLFEDLAPGAAAINVDDPFGRELAARVAPAGSPRTAMLARFSTAAGADAEIAPEHLSFGRAGIHLRVKTPAGVVEIRSPLSGAHNASNLLCALAIAWLLDLDVHAAAAALSTAIGVPGRLERCDSPADDDILVLVDYAHTPDALARVLESVSSLGAGSVICVFGCGGDRDPKKRPLMGAAVGEAAAWAIVTNDNPRSEEPGAIAAAILGGLEGTKARVTVELDRRKAIDLAIAEAAPGDVVLIAGKGHEPYQIIGATTFAFDDRDEARRALAARRAARRAA
ncbi:MAG: UDP-N-acetylmuramoyl-L-alanyl-D-glutamate--2,6-diaminopimelate ligase [Byssovorax sp.]